MKLIKQLTALSLIAVYLASPTLALAADKKDEKAKPYSLKTCIVQDEKLDKDAFTFVHKGQEIKVCCEGCKDDFDKEPAKYLKKLEKPAKK